MAISLASLQHGVSVAPPILCCFGDEGIGKSKFAANAPNPVFIFTENSIGTLDVPRWNAKSYEDVMEMTATLLNEEHDFKTVVYDTLDWMEPLLWNYLIRMQPTDEKGRTITNVDGYGFGKGYKYALDYWKDFLELVDQLRITKNMAVIFLAHSTLQKITPPDGDSYDSWTLKLQNSDKVSAKDKITEYCDAVLFANWRVAVTEEELGFNKTRNIGKGAGERIVYTEKRPAFDAKNRFSLPASIPIKDADWGDLWAILATNIPWFKQFTAEAEAKPEPKRVPAKVEKKVEEPVAQEEAKSELPAFLKKKA